MKKQSNVDVNTYFKNFLESIPDDIKQSVDLSMAIASQINSVLKKKNLSQRDLAAMLNKKESEISKWLSGNHNFTTNTIAKIQSVLGEQIVTVPIYSKKEIKFIPVQSYSALVQNGTIEDFSVDNSFVNNNSNLIYETVINCKEGCYGSN